MFVLFIMTFHRNYFVKINLKFDFQRFLPSRSASRRSPILRICVDQDPHHCILILYRFLKGVTLDGFVLCGLYGGSNDVYQN